MPLNHQFARQLAGLLLLTLIPIIMIGINGTRAIRGILFDRSDRVKERATLPVPKIASELAMEDNSRIAAKPVLGPPEARGLGLSDDHVTYGIYDPTGEFDGEWALSFRHVYVSWAEFDRLQLLNELRRLEQAGHQILLTIEPWPKDSASVLPAILQGKYDTTIFQLVAVLNALHQPIYISWGHEMDQDLIERYAWSGAPPHEFIRAYRYVVSMFRNNLTIPSRWLWTGVLKEGSLAYWPGDDYVDIVGMPVYSFPAWDQQNYGYIREFSEVVDEKMKVIESLDKPVMITELGVSGSSDFESFWLRQVFAHLSDYSQIRAVHFFFARDVEGAWGDSVPTPDWRVDPDAIRGLIRWHDTIESNKVPKVES